MKKSLFLIAITIAAFFTTIEAKAQSNTVGLRTTLIGVGYEISYQHQFNKNRLELELGLHQDSEVSLAGIYQWVGSLGVRGLNWYAGVGIHTGVRKNIFMLGILADAGIEYNLNCIPLQFFRNWPVQISLDYRPTYYLIPQEADFYGKGLAIGVRYRF